jgi:fructose-specific phosphotransferase system IIC component
MTPFIAFGGLVVAVAVSVEGVANDTSVNGKVLIVEVDLHHSTRYTAEPFED